jgi:hypothetical protein
MILQKLEIKKNFSSNLGHRDNNGRRYDLQKAQRGGDTNDGLHHGEFGDITTMTSM